MQLPSKRWDEDDNQERAVWLDVLSGGEEYEDIVSCLDYNPVEFSAMPRKVHLELTGWNDGANWSWILELVNGKWMYLTGGCDYTGWDCQSGADGYEADSLEEVLRLVPEADREVFLEMLASGETKRDAKSSW